MIKLTFLIATLSLSVYSQQIETVEQSINGYSIISTDSSSFKETTEKKLINYWGLHVGYFPDIINNIYNSQGLGFILSTDNYSGKFVNWGWYFMLKVCIPPNKNRPIDKKGEGGSITIGASLSHHFSKEPASFVLKIGLGLKVPIYPHLASIISIEHQFPISRNIYLTISLIEEIVFFHLLTPPLISVGILF